MVRKAIRLWWAWIQGVSVDSLAPSCDVKKLPWVSVEDELPEDEDRQYLIRHYNNFTEVARRENGEWFAISDRISEPDFKLSKEGQPDYWLLITEP